MPVNILYNLSSISIGNVVSKPHLCNCLITYKSAQKKPELLFSSSGFSIILRLNLYASYVFEDQVSFGIKLHHDNRIFRNDSAQNAF